MCSSCLCLSFPQLCAELKQVQTKLSQVEQSAHSQENECEHQQQKIRELEVALARNATNHSATTSLQEDLQSERVRLIAADKKVRSHTLRRCFSTKNNVDPDFPPLFSYLLTIIRVLTVKTYIFV